MLDDAIVDVKNLKVEFWRKEGSIIGVEDVSFDVRPGETLCIVGESGSGKSVSSLSLMRLIEFGGGEISQGKILFDRGEKGETNVVEASQDIMRDIRGNEISMIFQEPMTALNPVFTVGRQLVEALRVHGAV
ncbi:MAG: ATP-binding cassette domain-containing protein, partial [Pseudomonadota bacterium]